MEINASVRALVLLLALLFSSSSTGFVLPATSSTRSTTSSTLNFALQMSTSTSRRSNAAEVVVVGSANQDLTAYTATVPRTGETVLGESFETSFGGKGANQGVAAAALGIVPVSMVCKVGADAFGAELLGSFRDVNLQYDESSVVAPDVSTGVAQIIVDTRTGDNMIIVVPGANHALTSSDVRSAITSMARDNQEQGERPMTVVVQLEIRPEVALEALKVAKEVGATTIFNPAPAPEGWELDSHFYKYADIVIPNETELRSLCKGEESAKTDDEEAMAKTLFARGVSKAVIVTLGARGAMVVSKSEDDGVQTELVCAPPDLPCNAEPVVDTVGAGDSFCGSLSAYLSAGLTLGEAATKACGVASMSVRKRGAQSSYPTASELPDILRLS
jgi:ribokinase